MSTTYLTVERVAVQVLAEIAARVAGGAGQRDVDWGVPLLARLVASTEHRDTARAATLAWAARYARASGHQALFGTGLGGNAVGLAHAALIEPRLDRVAQLAADRLTESAIHLAPAETVHAGNRDGRGGGVTSGHRPAPGDGGRGQGTMT